MHAMMNALKKHIGKSRGLHAEGSVLEEKGESKKEEQKETDNAPELDDSAGHPALGDHRPMMSGELGPEHIELLKLLLGSMSHPGREPISLNERVHAPMQEKVAMLSKHKK